MRSDDHTSYKVPPQKRHKKHYIRNLFLIFSLLVITYTIWNNWEVPVLHPIVILDPGHDSLHQGASYNGGAEQDLTLEIAKACRDELTAHGVTVYMTRESDTCPIGATSSNQETLRACLSGRVDYAKEHHATIFVSLHLNAADEHTSSGALVLIPNTSYRRVIGRQGKRLGESIVTELASLGLRNRGTQAQASTDGYKNPDGSTADYYKVIRESKWAGFPGVIVEHAFLDNPDDYANYLSSPEKLKALGQADARGILKYLGIND